MKSTKYARVNMRSTRTEQEKATCTQCHCSYNGEQYLTNEGICYRCSGFSLETVEQFFAQKKGH